MKGDVSTNLIRMLLWSCLVVLCVAIFLSLRPLPRLSTNTPSRNGGSFESKSHSTKPEPGPSTGYSQPSEPKAEPTSTAPPSGFTRGGEEMGAVSEADIAYLASRNLLIPVAGVKAGELRDSFNDARSEGRRHEAIDIMAPQGTQVLATTDGVVVKLFRSEKGGITLYEQDPSDRYIYYYAHLMRYADGISEGEAVKRGDVIAYVGDTGDAGAGNFHLHFSISKVLKPRQWSGGDPINPYPLLAGKPLLEIPDLRPPIP